MKKFCAALLVIAAVGLGTSSLLAQGQGAEHAVVVIPDSSVEHPGDAGVRSHTNHMILDHPMKPGGGGGPSGETPGSLGCVYGIVTPLTSGCPIATSTAVPSGGNGTIAIVDAFDYPTAANDIHVFSTQFGLPDCTIANGCFSVVYASGVQPKANCGWAQEAALDIEWAHAMAPNAKIALVEAATNRNTDLYQAVDVASSIVSKTGRAGTGLGQVSMSWGSGESSSESSNDGHFTTSGVVYFAASGDTGGKTIYPGVSPNVVCAGGTSVNRSGGKFSSETAWSGSGGGTSAYEPIPTYQSVNGKLPGTKRVVPDFSFDANPNTGVAVYDSTSCQGRSGWLVFGGTSVASPSLAGIVNLSGSRYNSSANELNNIYSCLVTKTCYSSNFNDILTGSAGSSSAGPGWDFVTGVGSNKGTGVK